MTKDEVLKMAIEHGFKRVIEPPCEYYKATEEQIEAFAKALAEQPTNMVTVPLDKLEDMQRRLKVTQWQGLSDEEILRLEGLDCVDEEYIKRFARAIEAKLREKNDG